MSATRRQIAQLAARKTTAPIRGVAESGSAATTENASADVPSGASVDPVSADPAVVLWDEVEAPDPAVNEEPASKPAGGIPDKALH